MIVIFVKRIFISEYPTYLVNIEIGQHERIVDVIVRNQIIVVHGFRVSRNFVKVNKKL